MLPGGPWDAPTSWRRCAWLRWCNPDRQSDRNSTRTNRCPLSPRLSVHYRAHGHGRQHAQRPVGLEHDDADFVQVGVSRPRDHTRIGWARTGPQRSDLTSPQYVRALKHCRMVMHGEWGMGGFFCQARARCGVTLSRLAHDPRHRDPVGLSGRCDLTAGLGRQSRRGTCLPGPGRKRSASIAERMNLAVTAAARDSWPR